jgi:hypothetical protein
VVSLTPLTTKNIVDFIVEYLCEYEAMCKKALTRVQIQIKFKYIPEYWCLTYESALLLSRVYLTMTYRCFELGNESTPVGVRSNKPPTTRYT